MVKVGIITGSGLDDPQMISDYKEVDVDTKYGKPSSKITTGTINGIEVCILARHGKKHEISPSNINFRANIAALKLLGCTHIIATSAVGSLREEIAPGDLVFPDQFIDFTKQRKMSFYDENIVTHIPMSEPFSAVLRNILAQTADSLGFKNHKQATILVIEGPRFSTKSESLFFKQIADIIGMTACPECILAKEAEIEYATIAMSTDYDCWKEDEAPVTFEIVKQRMKENADKVKRLIINVLPKLANPIIYPMPEKNDMELIKSKIRTIPDFPKPGIMFRDITTLIRDACGFEKLLKHLEDRYKFQQIDLIAGIESRGFIVASALASRLKKGVILLRKKGKLPAETISEEYNLEYGKDSIELHKDAVSFGQRVLLVDDLIATGGTAEASCRLIERLGGQIVECVFVVELPELKGREKLGSRKVHSVVSFEGH